MLFLKFSRSISSRILSRTNCTLSYLLWQKLGNSIKCLFRSPNISFKYGKDVNTYQLSPKIQVSSHLLPKLKNTSLPYEIFTFLRSFFFKRSSISSGNNCRGISGQLVMVFEFWDYTAQKNLVPKCC